MPLPSEPRPRCPQDRADCDNKRQYLGAVNATGDRDCGDPLLALWDKDAADGGRVGEGLPCSKEEKEERRRQHSSLCILVRNQIEKAVA